MFNDSGEGSRTRKLFRGSDPFWNRLSVATPLHEALEGVELRQAELVVDLGRVAVAVFGALPELAAVLAAREHRLVLLRLMTEDGALLAFQVARGQRHDPLDLVRLPFFPGAAVQPDFEMLAV